MTCYTINWSWEWPLEALQYIVKSFHVDVELNNKEYPDLLSGVVHCSIFIHQSVKKMLNKSTTSKLLFKVIQGGDPNATWQQEQMREVKQGLAKTAREVRNRLIGIVKR
ncbi:hypothetical protein BSKO_05751 [Bryopsis sp. KO-2023]|nr:hypothetical protein BSKO_05751 [Bryopsis sp. KO-2023]